METSGGAAVTTIGEADNDVYFTREQFVIRLRLPISSLVKQFLHFTRVPSPLIHPNVFRILMGCSVLNSLYQLDISLMEICFIYTLKLGIRGRLSMLAHSPLLQFVTGLPDFPKREAKGVVKGSWYETLTLQGFLLIGTNPFHSQICLCFDVSRFGVSHISLGGIFIDIPIFLMICR